MLAGHLSRFNDLGLLPKAFLLSRLDEGSDVQAALSTNYARYHKTCRLTPTLSITHSKQILAYLATVPSKSLNYGDMEELKSLISSDINKFNKSDRLLMIKSIGVDSWMHGRPENASVWPLHEGGNVPEELQ